MKWVVVEGEGEGDNQTTENQTALMMQGFSVPEGRVFFLRQPLSARKPNWK